MVAKDLICKKYGAVCQPIDEGQIIGAADNIFEGKINPLNGMRHIPDMRTSGWYLWAGGEPREEDDFFKPLHIRELLTKLPFLEKFLCLPPGYRFQIDGRGYEDVWFDANLLTDNRVNNEDSHH